LGAGPFSVTEEPDDSVTADVATIENIRTNVTGPIPSFSGDCTQTGTASFSATGNISAGGQQTCNIVNHYVINETDLCEACFNVNSTLKAAIEDTPEVATTFIVTIIGDSITIPGNVDTIEQLCPLLKGHGFILIGVLISNLAGQQFQASVDALIECPIEAGVIVGPTAGLTASNTNTAESLTSSSSSQPTIGPGTREDDLTAMEKLTKLKTQWLNRLP